MDGQSRSALFAPEELDELETLLSQTEASRLLGLTERTVRRHIASGALPVVQIGGRTLVHPEDLRVFVDERRGRRGGSP